MKIQIPLILTRHIARVALLVSQVVSPFRLCMEQPVDEMKVKEGLVYNKMTGEIVGFTNI